MRRLACRLAGIIALTATLTAQNPAAPSAPADPTRIEAVLETDLGSVIIRFFPDAAPKHVARFLKLAGEGFFDGLTFFRVIPYGIIQAGDPLTRNPAARDRYGTGGLRQLKAEFNHHPCPPSWSPANPTAPAASSSSASPTSYSSTASTRSSVRLSAAWRLWKKFPRCQPMPGNWPQSESPSAG